MMQLNSIEKIHHRRQRIETESKTKNRKTLRKSEWIDAKKKDECVCGGYNRPQTM